MFKIIKKVLLSSLSILGITTLIWTTLLFNPSLSYANKTQVDFVTVYHNEDLEEGAEEVILEAIDILKKSELYHDEITIDLCLNDDKIYPRLHPLVKDEGPPLAYAIFDKAIIKNCKVDFTNNCATAIWAANNNEIRKFKLSYLLAHEFTHNLQFDESVRRIIKLTKGVNIHWKLEGYSDYIARQYANDGLLKTRILKYLDEEKVEHVGFPVFDLPDGTKQIFWYFKCSLIVQYLMEVKSLSYEELCDLKGTEDQYYNEMLEWADL